MTKIQFCENNFDLGTEETMKKLKENFNNADVSVAPCLGQCGDCAATPYALVNGKMLQADTAEELYERLKDYM